jgi:DNA-binding IclR family transcriptional regulator
MAIVQEARRRGRPGSGQSESIQSLVKALAILDCLAHASEPVGVTEVANQIGVPKATAHRLLATLHANDAATYNPDTQRYSLGPSIMRYGLMGVQRLSLHRLGRPQIERLHKQTGETAVLAIRQGDMKVFLDQVESQEDIRHRATLGQRLPLYHGGAGHAILAFMPEHEREEYLSHGPFPKVMSTTITDPGKLRKELELVRQRRYAITRSDRVTSIGSPVLDHTGSVVGALAVFAPTFRVPDDTVIKFAEITRDAADELSVAMGHAPYLN